MSRVVVPLGHTQFDVGVDKGGAQRLTQYRRAGKGAQGVQQVERQPGDAGRSGGRLVHIDVESPAGIALVFDPIETAGEQARLQQIRVGRTSISRNSNRPGSGMRTI